MEQSEDNDIISVAKHFCCLWFQVKPIQFIIHAVVTTSDLQFDLSEVDFGYCSIYYSVKKRIGLTNLSLLPQEFGFVGIPEVLDTNY